MSILKRIRADGSTEVVAIIKQIPEDKSIQPNKIVNPDLVQRTFYPDSGYDSLQSVTVGAIPPSFIQPSGVIEINQNGEYSIKQYEKALVDVKISNIEITATNMYVEDDILVIESNSAQSLL